jgi:hypothetical protein
VQGSVFLLGTLYSHERETTALVYSMGGLAEA